MELKALSGILQQGRPLAAECEFNIDRLPGGARAVTACNACEVFYERVQCAMADALYNMADDMHIADFAYEVGQRLWAEECPNAENCPREKRQCLRWAETKTLPLAYLRVVLLETWAKRLSGDTVLSPVRAAAERGFTIPEAARGALEMLGKPAHYSEIAACVRKNNPRYAGTNDHALHARLIDADWFVMTDVGTYGLREWGVKEYKSVADRIEALLRAHGRPMAVRDVVERLAKQGTREGTVLANLAKGRFTHPSSGMIWLDEEVTASGKKRVQIVLQGKTFEANVDRKAVLIKCQPGDELFQELAEYAYSRGVLPDVWEWNVAGELQPERDQYKDEKSWLSACRRHVESGLFKIAEEDGLLVPELEADAEEDCSVPENTFEEEEVGSLFDLDDDDDVILF